MIERYENRMSHFKSAATLAFMLLSAAQAGAQNVHGVIHFRVTPTDSEVTVSPIDSIQAIRERAGGQGAVLCGTVERRGARAQETPPADRRKFDSAFQSVDRVRRGDEIQAKPAGNGLRLPVSRGSSAQGRSPHTGQPVVSNLLTVTW